MSHFLTLVLVEAAEAEPAQCAYELMAPYLDTEGGPQPPYQFSGCVIGGSYDGLITRKEQHHNLTPDEYEKRYGLEVITDEANMCWVVDLPEEVIPDAIVTSDGHWHDPAGTSWDDWKAKVWQVLHADSTRLAIAFDCHC